MRKCGLILLATLLALLTPVSCEVLSDWIHDDGVVARVGRHKLTLSQVEEIIPDGTSPEDSLNLALQYINNWASELLFSEVAAAQLTKSEQDVSRELEDYRHSLLKYRYEQRYLNERLDTVVSRNQIEQYYETHKDLFVLERPIVKSRFLDIMQESPYLEVLKGKMSSKDYEDVSQADSLAYSSALKYEDRSDRWIDMVAFARDFGTDYGTLLARRDRDGFIEFPGDGDIKIGYICDLLPAGRTAPLEYCEDRIKEIIISNRRRDLLIALEHDLLEDALIKKNFVIY